MAGLGAEEFFQLLADPALQPVPPQHVHVQAAVVVEVGVGLQLRNFLRIEAHIPNVDRCRAVHGCHRGRSRIRLGAGLGRA